MTDGCLNKFTLMIKFTLMMLFETHWMIFQLLDNLLSLQILLDSRFLPYTSSWKILIRRGRASHSHLIHVTSVSKLDFSALISYINKIRTQI